MRTNRLKPVVLVLICLFLGLNVAGCGAKKNRVGEEKTVETSQKKKPKWVLTRPKASKEYIYFVGDDTSKTASGVRDAYQIALSKISFYVKTKADEAYQRVSRAIDDESANNFKEELIRNVSQSVFRGVKEKQVYWEKIEKITPAGVSYKYRVYSLVEVPKDVLEKSTQEALMKEMDKNKENKEVYKDLKENVLPDLEKLFDDE